MLILSLRFKVGEIEGIDFIGFLNVLILGEKNYVVVNRNN